MSATVVVSQAESIELGATSSQISEPARSIQDAPTSGRTYAPVYDRFTKLQKNLMTGFIAYAGLLASMSTTTVLAAVPEISNEFNTTPTVINISNAVYLLFVGLSCFFWGPWADNFGRRSVRVIFLLRRSLGWEVVSDVPRRRFTLGY